MSIQDKLLKAAASAAPGGLIPSEHFGVVTYTGDGSSSNKVGDGSFTVLGLPDTGTAFPYLVSEKVYSSGKYYFEINDLANGDTGAMQCMVGIVPTSFRDDMTYPWKTGEQGLFWYQANGQLYNNGSGSGSFGTFAAGDDVAIAVDFDNNTMTLYKNGSQSGSQITGVPSGTYHMSVSTGYNQYKGKAALKETLMQYSIPSGYEAWGGDIDTSGDWSNYSEYDGVVDFQPDFVWIKNRDQADNHILSDSTRGINKPLVPNGTNSEGAGTGYVTSYDTGGFTLGNQASVNTSNEDYVAWCLKANGGTTSSNTDGTITSTVQANTDAGFSIVKWTTNGSASQTVGHGLTSTPELIFFKRLDSAQDWFVETNAIDGGYDYANLNTTAAFQDGGSAWSTRATSTTITAFTSSNNFDYIAYAFHSVDNFSKFGSYVGNGSTNGPIVETGFEPAFIMFKRTDSTGDWRILDNKRSQTNPRNEVLKPNSSEAEESNSTSLKVDFLSNGFQLKSTHSSGNTSGATYIYMCFAADADTEQPTVAKSFSTVTYTGNSSTQSIEGLGFSPSFIWLKNRDSAVSHTLFDVIRGAGTVNQLYSDDTKAMGADTTLTNLISFDSDGFTLGSTSGYNVPNNSGDDYVAWAWKADDNEPTLFGGNARAVYKFEDNANDVTGDYNGTASNVTYTSSGKFNKAADFNGTNSKITFSTGFSQQTSFTVSFWMKSSQYNDDHTIFQFEGDSNVNSNRIGLASSGTKFGIFPNNTTSGAGFTAMSASESSSLYDGSYHHVALVVDGTSNTSAKIYIDGVSKDLTTGESYTTTMRMTGNMRIGTRKDDDSNSFYDGEIDQLRIYSGAVSDIGVAALYAETTSDNDDLTLGAPKETIISANANAGFSIVKYEGDGTSGRRIPHGLSSAPELIIAKANITSSWVVYSSTTGTNKFLELNSTAAEQTISNYWGTSSPSATTFGVAPSNSNNNSTGNGVFAYCFHSVSGYSKIGSYSGNGTTGQTITTGFQPDFVMIKASSHSQDWYMIDSVRPNNKFLVANLSGSEYTADDTHSFTSTGFSLSGQSFNNSGYTYIYAAFKIN